MKRKVVFVMLSTLCFMQMAFSQNEDNEGVRLVIPEINFSYSMPTGAFGERVENNFIGIEAGIYFQKNPNHPFVMGLTIAYHSLGYHSVSFDEEIDNQIYTLTEAASSHNVTVLGTFRYYPSISLGEAKLYTDLYFGPKFLFTTLTLNDNIDEDIISDFDIEESNISMSYGIGLGVQIPIGEFIFLNSRVTYLPGVSTTYYSEAPDFSPSDFAIDAFVRQTSATEVLNLSLGISFFL